MSKQALWLRWVCVNALGEMVGLGLTLGLGAFYYSQVGEEQNVAAVLAAFVVAVASGAIEATIVGFAQWWAMRPCFPAITRKAWWLATLVGALIAYVLGYLPSTLMSLGEQSASAGSAATAAAASTAAPVPPVEPPQWVVLLLAAGLGLVGGAVLSFAQWLVLRKSVARSGSWIPANMLAWLFGMPLIFWGIDAAQKGQPLWQSLLIMALVLLIAGALVGSIHGAFLVRLASHKQIR